MCFDIYGDSGDNIEVADANGLNGFRNLTVGTTIVFPLQAGARS